MKERGEKCIVCILSKDKKSGAAAGQATEGADRSDRKVCALLAEETEKGLMGTRKTSRKGAQKTGVGRRQSKRN